MSQIERNKAVAVRWPDLVSRHDLAGLHALSDPNWTMTGGPPGLPTGPEGIDALFAHIGPVEQTWTVDGVIAHKLWRRFVLWWSRPTYVVPPIPSSTIGYPLSR